MKHGIQMVLLFSVLFGLSNCKKPENDILYNKKYIKEIKAARKDLGYYLGSNFIPGASIAVMKDGELIYSEGIGYASKDLDVRANRSTKFRIGNTSELFTNVIYQKLVEEGILHPDSSVQHYYPEFPEKAYKITVNDLAQQISGIRDPNSNETNQQGLNVKLEKGLEQVINEPLKTPPGVYQTTGFFNYNLLGVVMKKATQMSYSKLLEKYVTDTLNLSNTVMDNPFLTIKNRSDFYDQNYIAQVVNETTRDLRYRSPSDGLLSNAEDLAKLGNTILNSDYLSEETRANLWQAIPLYNDIPSQVANAWMLLIDNEGNKIYGKAGSVSGGSSSLVIYPDENLIVAFACNLTMPTDKTPIFNVAKYFLPNGFEKETTANDEK
ncbi:serine hydrolase [Prolixibacteraceae bacterium Z1-6]|uniref:Serine hydrolase n=1 Tax=Draconibacterium aestuarii TaxID=2998507 RepID=A0A9X3F8X3_9BACT|nr:serine hydrolase [Prolixibacteraceae bacterium Z1-6]